MDKCGPICGDGRRIGIEECDDGNLFPGTEGVSNR